MRQSDGHAIRIGRARVPTRLAAAVMAVGLVAATAPAGPAAATDPPRGGDAVPGGSLVSDIAAGVKKAGAYYDYLGGLAALEKGDNDAAITCFTEAIRLDPHLAIAYADRGAAHGRKGDLDKALADCDEAIRLDPRLGKAYGCRGTVWLHRNQIDRALADLNEAIRLDPRDARSFASAPASGPRNTSRTGPSPTSTK